MNGTLKGFPPIANAKARVLVLGSMPGIASLEAREYYAHPRNLFWRITGEIFGFDAATSYVRRTAALRKAGIALWDVVGSCVREGSLDSSIEENSIRANDFPAFLRAHPRIRTVCFNGRKAESAWRRHVLKKLPPGRKLDYCLLPSTSPAHAGMGYLQKLRVWRSSIPC